MEEDFSVLLSRIPGVGKKRAARLIEEGFSTPDSVLSAEVEDIAMVAGVGWELATRIKKYFEEQFLREYVPFSCPVCGELVEADETRCSSCGTVLPAKKKVEVEPLDSLLEELEKDISLEEERPKEIEEKEEAPRVLARDFLDRWKRIQEGEELPRAQKIEEQIRHYDRLLEADPTLERAWLKKAELLVELGRYDEAIECYDMASELNPEMEEQYKLEVLNILQSKEDVSLIPDVEQGPHDEDADSIERAIRHYDALLRLDPSLKMAWQTKGELLERLGRHDEAIECYEKAIESATLERVRDIREMASLSRLDVLSRRTASKGLINGLGRTNGLVNGLVNGKVNGLVNGLGKVNGLVNGLVNGRGRVNGLVNGLVNGRGRVNGLVNGLINGNGLVNGRAGRVRPLEVPRGPARWSRGLAGVAAILIFIILGPMLGSIIFVPDQDVIEIDGDFGDWSELSSRASPIFVDDSSDQPDNPDVNILNYRLFRQHNRVYLYAEVEGSFLNGTGQDGIDNLFLLVDRDRDASTGYRADDLGVDDLIHLSGWNNSCSRGDFLRFSTSSGRDNWEGFTPFGSVTCEVRQNQLEAVFSISNEDAKMMLATSDILGNMDIGDAILRTDLGALTIDVETVAPEIVSQAQFPVISLGLSIQATSIDALSLNFSKQGNVSDDVVAVSLYRDVNADGVWDASDAMLGTSSVTDRKVQFQLNTSADPLEGNVTVFAVALLSSMPQTQSFGLRLNSVEANSTVLIRETFVTNSYILSSPNVTVDGAFADWNGSYQMDANDDIVRIDSSNTTVNENIDLRNYSHHRAGNVSFYLEVDPLGRMLGGDLIPALYERPGPYVPSYLDSDYDTVPDELDGPSGENMYDFDNDGIPDMSEGGDVDSDDELDYPFGDDYWLETVLPASYAEPYANQSVRRYIGPMPAEVSEGMDRVVLYLDRDGPSTGLRTIADGQSVGYDFMLLVTGRGGRINSTGLYVYNQSSTIPWELDSQLNVATDSTRMELDVPAQVLNLTDDFFAQVYMIDWSKSYDRSDSALTNATSRSRTRSPAGDDVVLNEIRADKKNNEWIELVNPTDSDIDISGWELVVDGTTIYTFPSGTTIGAFGSGNEYLVVDFSGDLIPDDGGNVKLVNGTTDIDETDYSGHKSQESWSRYRETETGRPVDTDDPDDWYVSSSPTRGGPNDQTKPSMVVSKVSDKTSAAPGEEVTYTVYYNNTGSTKAKNVWLNDTLPDGVTYISSSRPYTSQNGNTYRFNDTVSDGVVMTNFVTLDYANEDEVWQPGSESNVSFTTARPIISVVKTVDKSEAQAGDTLNYTIYYNNTGSASAAHVWVNDTLPDNVTFQSSSEAYESQNGNTYVWHFTDVAPGSHSFTITVTVDADVPPGITLINYAFLNYTTQNSYGLEESSDSASTYIPEFQDVMLPLVIVFAVFALIRRRKVADGVPRTNDR
jgi:uncharacterized repeat protein (TIGR01451 family)